MPVPDNVSPSLILGGPPPEQLPFLFNISAPPKFAAQLKSIKPGISVAAFKVVFDFVVV